MLQKINTCLARWLSFVMVLMLALMVVLVFTNVVMRYAFNSGISISEELSRWLFVWMVFLGSYVGLHEHTHLGTDSLVARLPLRGKQFCLAAGHLLMLYLCWLLFNGTWTQFQLNLDTTSPVMGISMSLFLASGLVFAGLGALSLVNEMIKLFTGRLSQDELIGVRESEDLPAGPRH